MIIDAIIVCVNYSDFLAITLPLNKKHFNKVIVITNFSDKTTQELCLKEGVECCCTDLFYYNGARFNKGLAINYGIEQSNKQWVLNLDADIVLPSNFRELLEDQSLNQESSYGARRYDIPTFQEWVEVNQNPELLQTKTLFRGIGYGNFFLFNYQSQVVGNLLKQNNLIYPFWLPTGSESDWIFRNYWSDWIYNPPLTSDPNLHSIPNKDHAANLSLLKELPFCIIHLGETGVNEFTRKTSLWAP